METIYTVQWQSSYNGNEAWKIPMSKFWIADQGPNAFLSVEHVDWSHDSSIIWPPCIWHIPRSDEEKAVVMNIPRSQLLSRIDAMLDICAHARDAFPAGVMQPFCDFYASVHEALKKWKNVIENRPL